MSPKDGFRPNKSKGSSSPKFPIKPAPGVLIPAPPPSDEEKAVASYIADEIKHSIMVAAVSPLHERFPDGSYAAIMQNYLKKKGSREQEKIRNRAKSLLTAPLAKRRLTFGRFADKGTRIQKQGIPGIDTTLETALKKAFESKLKHHNVDKASGVLAKRRPMQVLPNTVLKIDLGGSEFGGIYRTNLELNQPDYLQFYWETKEPEATFVRWEIKVSPGLAVPDDLGGTAGQVPRGNFHIDFRTFLAAIPPEEPQYYYVRVQPMKAFPRTPGSLAVKLPEPVGLPSNWVTITYKKGGGQTQFELPPTDLGHYQRISLYVNAVRCIEETGDAGDSDEILLGGFNTLSNGRVVQQGTWTVSEDFDKGEVKRGPILWTSFKFFHGEYTHGNLLGQEPVDSFTIPWPRSYAFTFVMTERDEGGTGEIIANLIIRVINWIDGAIREAVEGYVGQYTGEEAAKIIAAIVCGILAELFDLIKEALDNPDDLIAQNTYLLWLNSSKVSDIHRLPGQVINLPDKQTEFVSNHQVLRFTGGDDSAGGIYDVEVFWKASNRYFNY